MKMKLYVYSSPDKYEFPIAIGESAEELAEQLGMKPHSIFEAIAHNDPRWHSVEINEDEDWELVNIMLRREITHGRQVNKSLRDIVRRLKIKIGKLEDENKRLKDKLSRRGLVLGYGNCDRHD